MKTPRNINELPDVTLAALPISRKLLEEVCPALQRDLFELVDQLRQIEQGEDAPQVARAFVALHRLREVLNTIIGDGSSVFSGTFGRYKTEVVRCALERMGVDHLPLSEGFRVGLTGRTTASIPVGKRADAHQWLRDNGLSELIVETVNAQTLSAAVTSMIQERNIDPPSELFNLHRVRYASVTKI